MRVISFDTGDLCGIGMWTEEDGIWSDALARNDAEAFAETKIPGADVVILERLTIGARTKGKSTSVQRAVESAGVIKYLARKYEKPLVEQMPGDVMRFANNDRLKILGWHVPGPDHQNDARRHILTWLAEHALIDTVQLLQ